MSDPIVGYMLGEFSILVAAAACLYLIMWQVQKKAAEAEELKRKQRVAEREAEEDGQAGHG